MRQQWLYRQLSPEARTEHGLSPINRLVAGLILASVLVAILETEDTLAMAAPGFFAAVNAVFLVAFVLEYAARLYVAGHDPRYQGSFGRVRYVATPLAIIDLLVIVSFALSFLPAGGVLFRLFRLFALLRVAKLGRYSSALKNLGVAIRMRRQELMISVAIGGVVLVVSATLLYLTEGGAQPETFGSVPRALWWSVMTLTTVGYGDALPVTQAGRVLAGLTAITGIGLIAMPTGIIAAALSDVFQHRRQATGGDAPAGDREPERHA